MEFLFIQQVFAMDLFPTDQEIADESNGQECVWCFEEINEDTPTMWLIHTDESMCEVCARGDQIHGHGKTCKESHMQLFETGGQCPQCHQIINMVTTKARTCSRAKRKPKDEEFAWLFAQQELLLGVTVGKMDVVDQEDNQGQCKQDSKPPAEQFPSNALDITRFARLCLPVRNFLSHVKPLFWRKFIFGDSLASIPGKIWNLISFRKAEPKTSKPRNRKTGRVLPQTGRTREIKKVWISQCFDFLNFSPLAWVFVIPCTTLSADVLRWTIQRRIQTPPG